MLAIAWYKFLEIPTKCKWKICKRNLTITKISRHVLSLISLSLSLRQNISPRVSEEQIEIMKRTIETRNGKKTKLRTSSAKNTLTTAKTTTVQNFNHLCHLRRSRKEVYFSISQQQSASHQKRQNKLCVKNTKKMGKIFFN